ncbi:amino acid/amide ABC transporter ATP-binding protein 1, HAAT family (TC 3.A.1.4.-) [Mesorhizobium albiziae]|uniref:Amino acid/amide ABC transporter ATP-binding protein 1, HAAT family (TC 3.A.1.4.-) n=1 Tax=Neomesorhizobium albiziae TaxID=335020 RepID=A0A1I4ETY6_9HYPH|nr:ABC transporter ATP-binding protein [Mesorhizobium albiziae]GLS32674.1 ABC transporter ATP-binding protein [Mesorhizobium albiziae]SFL09154.1 amino acid/amide ABC transporter ATP-binding protein 1, HAAT family (TC 3.A.1.4.-) [Mesorhizobium albiziae]
MLHMEIKGLSKSFGALRVADGIDLRIQRGEAVGIIGPNGAGKTTFFNLIAGDLFGDAGTVVFKGTDVTGWDARERSRACMARTYQIPQPFHGMTVYENVLVGAVFAGGRSQSQSRQHCEEILQQTHLSEFANTPASSLTLLNRKRLELARALGSSPELLLLDEIAGGLTDAECSDLVKTILDINAHGVTVIWIEHVVHALLEVVNRLVVLNAGSVLRDGEPHRVMRSPDVREIYLGVEPEADGAGS